MDPSGEQGDGPMPSGPPHIPQGDGSGPPPGSNFQSRPMQPQGDMNEELMIKVRQQQRMIDMDKQREAQQQLMEQQQLAMLEVQRGEQQQRMPGSGSAPLAPPGMPATSGVRSSGVQMVTQQRPSLLPHQGGPPQPPQMMSGQPSGAQNMGQSGPGGPPPQGMGQGGPQMGHGDPSRSMAQGGPLQPMGQNIGQGGPPPNMGQGGPPQGAPPQGGPPRSMGQGGPPQGAPSQSGPPRNMGQGGPPQGVPPQSGPPRSMGQGGPQQGPPLQSGPPRNMGQSGPLQGGPPQSGPPRNMAQGGPPHGMRPTGPPQNMGAGPGAPPQMRGPMGQGGQPQGIRPGGPSQGMHQGGPPPGMRGGPPPSNMGQSGGPPLIPGGPGSHMGQPRDQDGVLMDIDERRPPLMDIDERIRDDGRRPNQMENNNAPPRPQGPPPPMNQNQGRMNRAPYNGPSGPLGKEGPNRPPPSSQSQGPKEMRLPQALEKMLEFKSQREHEIGLDLDNEEEKEKNNKDNDDEGDNEDFDPEENEDDEDEENDERIVTKDDTKETKNKRKKKKKKKARRNRFEVQKKEKKKRDKKSKAPEVIVEYIQEEPELDPSDPSYHTFAKIFEAFKITQPEHPKEIKQEDKPADKVKEEPVKVRGIQEDDDDEDDDDMMDGNDEDGPKISKKKLKKLTRLTVAQLKQLVTRPDVVEMHDVTARDPRLLVHLKATRNSVPVPRHWSYKRKYLQGKRGIEKTPFELPDFIKATGIEEMRAALQEKEDQKTLKSKMREKVRPKMGKIDIDYQKLHDAFFRFQTKPKMTIHGDLYYEAKEFETKLREKKPGNISDDLKMALGMPIGLNSDKVPPPWLIAMQRYGPPPSYPNLKIAGLNGPIPEGCMFGYHAGGWGKPPVDENGKPLYGDVFGTQGIDLKAEVEEDDIDKTHWGELESESESEESSEEEEEEDKDESGLITPAEGLMTPGGITSVPIGIETPDQIELRKKRIEDAMDQGGDTPALYQVVPEKKAAPVGGAMMGSAHVYDLAAVAAGQKKPGEKPAADGIEVSLNPEELELDTAAMQAKYDQTVREQQSQLEKEDLSDMVAAHAAKQRKRKKAQENTSKGAKKYKDFKF